MTRRLAGFVAAALLLGLAAGFFIGQHTSKVHSYRFDRTALEEAGTSWAETFAYRGRIRCEVGIEGPVGT
jgi:hypothetical protein